MYAILTDNPKNKKVYKNIKQCFKKKDNNYMARMKFIYAIAIIAALMIGGLIINLVSSLF